MSTLKYLCLAFLVSAMSIAFFSCGGDCKRASDCGLGEVCYNEICQKAFSADFEGGCQTDLDCDGDGDGQTNFFCELGRCRLKNPDERVIPPDSGIIPDTGIPDTGIGTSSDAGP